MTNLNIVELPIANLQDIPGQLRALADRIKGGEYGNVDGLFVIIPREREYPVTLGFGIIEGAYDPIIQFELARNWMIRAASGLEII